MRRLVFLIIISLLLTGCASHDEQLVAARTDHVTEHDYMNDRYFLALANPDNPPDGETPVDYAVFERDGNGFRMLLNAGPFYEIYDARGKTLSLGNYLYIARDKNLIRYDLTAKVPKKTEFLEKNFFPDEMIVIQLNALDTNSIYVYAMIPEKQSVAALSQSALTEKTDDGYFGYFAVARDKSGYHEVSFDDFPIQKRY